MPDKLESPLRSLLETAPDAIIVINDRGLIESVNGVAEQLFGYAARDIVGRNISILMPSPYREAHDRYIEHYLQTGQRRIIGIGRIVVGQRSGGSVFPMELYVGELQSEGRRLFSGFIRDLSTAQRVERRLQDLQSEFHKAVRLGGIGRMMTSLAHELNQPMSAVLSYAEAAQEILTSSTPDATKRAALPLSKAIGQAQRAAAVIRHMRDFVTHAAPPRRPEDLNTVVVEASALALSGGREDDLRINAQLDENLPMVLIDKAGVQEVAYNLISNAIRAMRGRNGGELTIQTYADAECTEVSVVVSDNGPGLPPEVRARLYQPFMGADQNGYGLGLTIAREIVESHGGRLVADDRPGGGARFKFTLPVATQNAD